MCDGKGYIRRCDSHISGVQGKVLVGMWSRCIEEEQEGDCPVVWGWERKSG